MTSVNSSVLFGGGYMGEVWLQVLSERSDVTTLVDVDAEVADLAQEYESNFILGDYVDESWRDSHQGIDEFLSSADMWCASVGPNFHEELVRVGVDRQIETIIIEKPAAGSYNSAKNIRELTEGTDTTVAVDYVETVNPALTAVIDRIDADFRLAEAYHWRGKNLLNSDGVVESAPYVYDDICHDVSELGTVVDLEQVSVASVSLQPAEDSANRDKSAEIELSLPNGKATVRGGYDQRNERRGFLWIDEAGDEAVFATTLSRYFVSPQAYHIKGEPAVDAFKTEFTAGKLVSGEHMQSLAADYETVECIYMQEAAEPTNVDDMFCRTVAGDPPTDLTDASSIHRVIADIYNESDIEVDIQY